MGTGLRFSPDGCPVDPAPVSSEVPPCRISGAPKPALNYSVSGGLRALLPAKLTQGVDQVLALVWQVLSFLLSVRAALAVPSCAFQYNFRTRLSVLHTRARTHTCPGWNFVWDFVDSVDQLGRDVRSSQYVMF